MRISVYIGVIAAFWTFSAVILTTESKEYPSKKMQWSTYPVDANKEIKNSFLYA